jgi:hypothetical protein
MALLRHKGVTFTSVPFEGIKSLLNFLVDTSLSIHPFQKENREGIRTQGYDGR